MALLTVADKAQMTVDLLAVRDDRPESIVLRRGDTALAAQTVRIARAGTAARRVDGGNAEQWEQRVVVLGAADLDIETGDRFNDTAGRLYEVDFVRPNRGAMTAAEAKGIE